MYRLSAILIGAGLVLGITGPAWATTCSPNTATTSPIFDTTNGTETAPYTNVGTIGWASGDVDQIGDLCLYNGGSGGALVSASSSPSIYEFYWGGGGILDIKEEEGNNGTGSIDAELYTLSGLNATSLGTKLSSIPIPLADQFTFYTLYDASLTAGYYAIDTYYGSAGTDPNYQIDFSDPPSNVPEPASLAVFGAALFGLGFFGFLRRRKDAA